MKRLSGILTAINIYRDDYLLHVRKEKSHRLKLVIAGGKEIHLTSEVKLFWVRVFDVISIAF